MTQKEKKKSTKPWELLRQISHCVIFKNLRGMCLMNMLMCGGILGFVS